jgi:hypothetical protein
MPFFGPSIKVLVRHRISAEDLKKRVVLAAALGCRGPRFCFYFGASYVFVGEGAGHIMKGYSCQS